MPGSCLQLFSQATLSLHVAGAKRRMVNTAAESEACRGEHRSETQQRQCVGRVTVERTKHLEALPKTAAIDLAVAHMERQKQSPIRTKKARKTDVGLPVGSVGPNVRIARACFVVSWPSRKTLPKVERFALYDLLGAPTASLVWGHLPRISRSRLKNL